MFCQNHSIHLISDEIYGLSVFETGNLAAIPFTSVLSFDPAGLIDPDYLHVFYGMSKVQIAIGRPSGLLTLRERTLVQLDSDWAVSLHATKSSCERSAQFRKMFLHPRSFSITTDSSAVTLHGHLTCPVRQPLPCSKMLSGLQGSSISISSVWGRTIASRGKS